MRRLGPTTPRSSNSNGPSNGSSDPSDPSTNTNNALRHPPRRQFSSTKASRKAKLSLPDGSGHTRSDLPVAVPGRAKRRRTPSFWKRCRARWVPRRLLSPALLLAIAVWFAFGILSIGTSKVLLSQHRVRPLALTFQQLLIGSLTLRFLLHVRFLNSPGLQELQPILRGTAVDARKTTASSKTKKSTRNTATTALQLAQSPLIQAGVSFSLGFWATNMGFRAAAPSFVETVKAAEPLTSAVVATFGGIEVLSLNERYCLIVLVMGVLLSTLLGTSHAQTSGSLGKSLLAGAIIMASNLCFSFRGYFQKILRSSHDGTAATLDDLNLQFRMQQVGAAMFALPVLLQLVFWPNPTSSAESAGWRSFFGYVGLALVNGLAFTTYNLASTYILSRLSVVHHAALNGLRRVVAVIVTSILFQVPLTFVGILGILISVVGFLSFTHYKSQRQQQPKNVSSLLPQRSRTSTAIPQGAPTD